MLKVGGSLVPAEPISEPVGGDYFREDDTQLLSQRDPRVGMGGSDEAVGVASPQ